MMTRVPRMLCLASLLMSLSTLTACVDERDEHDQEIDLAPEPDMNALSPDREVSDADAEISLPDQGEVELDQETPEIDADVTPDLEPAPAPDMGLLNLDMALTDMMLTDMTLEPIEVEWVQCEQLCRTEDAERLDGCSASCEPIAPEVCRQDCDPTNTVKAWSNTEYLDLTSPYDALYISDSGFVVQRLIAGNHAFELRDWRGALLHSFTLPSMPYGQIEVHLSREAALVYHEWDNAFGGELYLFSWEGVELAREEIVYMNYICRRPALFRDRVVYSALGPTYECFDTPVSADNAMYASQLVSVRASTRFEYDITLDDFAPHYTLTAMYYGHNEEMPIFGTVSGDTHDARVEAVSDVGIIYRDELAALQLAAPPSDPDARWTYHALAALTPDQTSAFQIKGGADEALYGVRDAASRYDLYQLTFDGATPQRFRLVRRFAESISRLTDHHIITREEETGIWVRHRVPACTEDGRCACLDESDLDDCQDDIP